MDGARTPTDDAPARSAAAGAPPAPLLAVRGIQKRFPGVHALRGVDFDVRAGEVHAVVGENGAGKSTLMHLLAGVYQPDEGTIAIDGEPVAIADEQAAQRLGIGIVYQERSLFPLLSVAENIYAGRQPVDRWRRIDRRRLGRASRAILDRLGLAIDPRLPLGRLSPAEQQMVEVAKALSLDAKLVILDEPTAALTATETSALFAVVAQLKREGVGVVYISHRLEEIFEIADRVTVLKDGALQGTVPVAETTPRDLVARMVGRDLLGRPGAADRVGAGRVVLEVRGLNDQSGGEQARIVLRDAGFEARAGEVLAFAGLAGAGRTELMLSIFGARLRASGEILVDGRTARIGSPEEAIAAGIGYLPEDRKEAGLFLEMSIADNIAAGRLDLFGSWWLDNRKRDAVAADYRARLRIASRGVRQPVRSLSGGNQQKVVLAKWLLLGPKVLIVDEPTRGVDVGAKAEVHALLTELARQGTAVIVVSSELPEVLAVADRILVMREGRITGELSRAEATEERVMDLASIEAVAPRAAGGQA